MATILEFSACSLQQASFKSRIQDGEWVSLLVTERSAGR